MPNRLTLPRRILNRDLLMASAASPKHLFLSSTFLPHSRAHLSPKNPLLLLLPRNLRKPLYPSRLRVVLPTMMARNVHSAAVDEETAAKARLAELLGRLEEVGIPSIHCRIGQNSGMICPKCEGGKSKEKSFSIFIREDGEVAVWSCFRGKCGWRGHVQASGVSSSASLPSGSRLLAIAAAKKAKSKNYRVLNEEELQLEPLCEDIISYFNRRMISLETLRRNAVMQRNVLGQMVMVFTYRRNGILVNCKYRDVNKKFWQEKDTEKILYGLDDIVRSGDVIIVEGEMDKLSMEEAGFRNCVSVPDGAPSKVSEKKLPEKEEDAKYEYLWNCKEYLVQASRIILATDADEPGQALAEELARRLGKERCWRVTWPKRGDAVCKDANEVLMYLGPEALREVIENAELYPIRGLFKFGDFFDEIDAYFYRNYGYELGLSTGWKSVDDYYRIVPGELTVVTGVPNSGKSEWIDALLCNINRTYGWKFALCSMENKVREHARKLLEKHIQKPFFDARYGEEVERMNVKEFELGKEWLNETFYLIRCEDDSLPSINWVLDLAKAAVLRHGIRGLIIDPYNELDHQRPSNQTETEYVSQMLTKVKRFAQHHACHVWFVAHPRQLQNWSGGAPNMYDISGSAHFINKCDNGIVVHRNRDKDAGPLDRVEICIRKVRNKVVGGIGEAFLRYSRVTGEYFVIDETEPWT